MDTEHARGEFTFGNDTRAVSSLTIAARDGGLASVLAGAGRSSAGMRKGFVGGVGDGGRNGGGDGGDGGNDDDEVASADGASGSVDARIDQVTTASLF